MRFNIILILIVMLSLSSLVSSKDYFFEFEQVADKILIREGEIENSLKYLESEDLEVSEKEFFFIKKIYFKENYENVKITVILDDDYKVDEEATFPKDYSIENGKNQRVVWTRTNVTRSEPVALFVQIDKKADLPLIFGSLIVLAVLSIILYKNRNYLSKFASKMNPKNTDSSHLLDEERKIISMLKEADRSELWQKEIQRKGELSKAKTSRLLRNLESRNLIKKIPMGNTNKIVLK